MYSCCLRQAPVLQVTDFKHAALFRVLVASYETLRKHTADLAGVCDVLVCDEGHRLKAAGGGKTVASLLALNCPRRILLTGTPLQNNLDEYYGRSPHPLLSFVKQLIPRATSKRLRRPRKGKLLTGLVCLLDCVIRLIFLILLRISLRHLRACVLPMEGTLLQAMRQRSDLRLRCAQL